MDPRTWEAAEARRHPVRVAFPDGRVFAFPPGVAARRVFALNEELRSDVRRISAVVEARVAILQALVPRTDEEVQSRIARLPDDVDRSGMWLAFDDLIDALDFDEVTQLAGFLYQTYVLNMEPSSVDEVGDADPLVLTPELPTDS